MSYESLLGEVTIIPDTYAALDGEVIVANPIKTRKQLVKTTIDRYGITNDVDRVERLDDHPELLSQRISYGRLDDDSISRHLGVLSGVRHFPALEITASYTDWEIDFDGVTLSLSYDGDSEAISVIQCDEYGTTSFLTISELADLLPEGFTATIVSGSDKNACFLERCKSRRSFSESFLTADYIELAHKNIVESSFLITSDMNIGDEIDLGNEVLDGYVVDYNRGVVYFSSVGLPISVYYKYDTLPFIMYRSSVAIINLANMVDASLHDHDNIESPSPYTIQLCRTLLNSTMTHPGVI